MSAGSVGSALAGGDAESWRHEPGAGAVNYRVTPELDGGTLRTLSVEARFTADASGRTILELPDHGGDDKEWWRLLSGLRVENATVQEISPTERVLTSRPSAAIVVRYHVHTGYDHDPTVADRNLYRPIIRPAWFQVIGSSRPPRDGKGRP